jgi:hypothetical protein
MQLGCCPWVGKYAINQLCKALEARGLSGPDGCLTATPCCAAQVMDIRILAQHDVVMDERADQGAAIQYAAELLEKVAAQKEAAARIANYQRLFKQPETQYAPPSLGTCQTDLVQQHACTRCCCCVGKAASSALLDLAQLKFAGRSPRR